MAALMQTGPDSGSASAVKPTRATQTSHPLPAFGPYRVILSPPSLTRACTGSQTMQVSAASTTQASQTLGVPPGSISSTTQTSLIEQSSWATQLPVSREQGVMTQAVATSHADVGTEKLCLDIKRIVEQASCMHLDEPQQPNSAPAKSSSMTVRGFFQLPIAMPAITCKLVVQSPSHSSGSKFGSVHVMQRLETGSSKTPHPADCCACILPRTAEAGQRSC